MIISKYMKRNVVSIPATATIGDAATLYAEKHIGTLPVIDEDRKLVGVLHPITIAMIPVIYELGAAGVNINPLWWALVFGAGFGDNGTIIGSTANVVVVSIAEKARTPITSAMWSRIGLPVMIISCVVSSVLFTVFYPWFAR